MAALPQSAQAKINANSTSAITGLATSPAASARPTVRPRWGSALSGPREEVSQYRCQNVVGYPVPLTGQAAVGAVG